MRAFVRVANASEKVFYYLSKLGSVSMTATRLSLAVSPRLAFGLVSRAKVAGQDFYFRPMLAAELYMALGIWEPYVVSKFKPSRGSTVIDVGAHIGYYALRMSKLVGPDGLIVAIEPDPRNYDLLTKNVARNRLSNIITLNIAVGDKNNAGEFMLARNSLFSQLASTKSKDYLRVAELEIMTLDRICEEFDIRKVDWLKVDVEEGASSVIRGGTSVLRKKVQMIVEAPDSRTLDLIRSLGYVLRKLEPSKGPRGYYYGWNPNRESSGE